MAGPIVIVGASLAGGTAAVTLREEGYEGEIVLVGAEPHPPYERPPLSKEFLRGEKPFEKALVKSADYWASAGIDARFGGRVERVDPDRREVALAGGERIPYEKVLVTTGGRNRRLAVPGADLEGVHDLRTVEDAERIRADAGRARAAVVVGMGFIGSEVAASLRAMGCEVTAIEPFPTPLYRVLGPEVGAALAALHRDHGVRTIFEDQVEAFRGSGRVEEVVTARGERIGCDLAVVGVGIEPAVEVVAGTRVALENGILVDSLCRTSVPDVYAAGDVANHEHPLFGRRMRVEHWQNAIRQGQAAARSMLGKGAPYAEVHWFWSDQYDANLQYAGHHTRWDRLVVRGSLEERSFVAFYLADGLVDAAVALNRGRDLRRAMGIIQARRPVDPDALADEAVDLRALAG
jgi:3-phenylpropionate/trans-cinnamate dioxygenase ferredoxin reductase subunit